MNVLLVYPAPPPSAWPKGAFRSRWIPSGLACIATVLRRGGHQVKIHLCEETLELNQYNRAAARAALAVPGAVAVTGWDDTDAAGPAGLTTVRQSLRDQGRRCARIALGHRVPDGQEPPGWEVVERTSTR